MTFKERFETIFANIGLTSRTNNKLYIDPPSPKKEREGFAIVFVCRDEEDLMREWLLHHLNAGFRHFFLYDNLSTDRTVEIARSVLKPDQLTVIPWKMQPHIYLKAGYLHQQSLAFAHAIQTFGANFQYMAFIDPDEFIVLKKRMNISDAFRDAGNPANMSLPWHMFGRSGHETPPPGGVGANFLRRYRDFRKSQTISKFKCIVDPCEVTRVSVHLFETARDGTRATNDVGKAVDNDKRFSPEFLSNDAIQLNHYFTRSNEDLQKKIHRSSNQIMKNGRYEKRVLRRVKQIESDEAEDRSLPEMRARAPKLDWL